ncbi:hypothetical protein LCGC14_1289650 [marine sediment metagenome]|uniref:Uncharacterized protein n=1 Tax=marine sediment metagenome TaxID=412755 RepID=A0A0F9NVT4_9ZZZZ
MVRDALEDYAEFASIWSTSSNPILKHAVASGDLAILIAANVIGDELRTLRDELGGRRFTPAAPRVSLK